MDESTKLIDIKILEKEALENGMVDIRTMNPEEYKLYYLQEVLEERDKVLNKLFALGGNHDVDALIDIRNELSMFFISNRAFNVQVADAITLTTIQLQKIKSYADYDNCMRQAQTVCGRLAYEGINDFIDVQLAAPFIAYAIVFEEAYDIAVMALEKLEEYQNESRYDHIKWAISGNMLRRLVLQMYSKDAKFLGEDESLYNAELIFRQHFDVAISYCKKFGDKSLKAVYWIRRGCYLKEKERILENFAWLKENDSEMHKDMLEELVVYGLDAENLKWE